jgi:hypothetical protein
MMSNVVAVVNHLGERMVITVEDYHRGQWQLWDSVAQDKGSDLPPDPLVSLQSSEDKDSISETWPQHIRSGWWRLSDGSRVRGEAEARRQQALLSI